MSVAEPPSITPPLPKRVPLPSGPLLGLLGVLALFVVLIGIKGELGSFLSLRNLQVLIHEGTIPGVLALGMLMVLITGGIDLSVGSVVALVTVVTMQVYWGMYKSIGTGPVTNLLAVSTGVAVGGLCGLSNGLLITRLRLPPFVATLGMLGIARGVAIWLAGRQLLAFPRDARPAWIDDLARVHPSWGLFNPGFWSLAVLAVLVAVLLRSTVLGRHVYAVGSSEATARLCGVSIGRTKLAVYTLAGLLAGWAGVLMFAHSGSGNPTAAEGMELEVIAAVVIGGASLGGGRGTVGGVIVGVLILVVLRNGVSLFNVPVEMQYILVGAIIIANVALSRRRRGEAD